MNAVLKTADWLTPGLHFDVPNASYHDPLLRPHVVSKGALDQVARSPAHWYAWAHGEAEKPTTDALDFGRAFHTLLLEPEAFAAEFAVTPVNAPKRPTQRQIDAKDPSLETQRAVAFWKAWEADNAGKTILDVEQMERLQAMKRAVERHPIAAKIIGTGKPEVTSVWRDDSGLLVKNRVDYLVGSTRYAMDLKTCLDASPQAFARATTNYRYHVQMALYAEGLKRNGFDLRAFCFLAVEKDPPYAPAIYLIDPTAEARGWELARRDLDTLARAIETQQFPAYSGRIETLALPPWAFTN